MEVVTDFLFLGFKITVDGDCSRETGSQLLPGRKATTSLDRVVKGKDTALPAKVCRIKAMVFPVVRYRSENWIIRKAECQQIGF